MSGGRWRPKTFIKLAQNVLLGHPQIFKLQFGGVMSRAQRMYDPPDMKARLISINNKTGHAITALVTVSASKDGRSRLCRRHDP